MTKRFKELTLEFLTHQYLFEIFNPKISGIKYAELFLEWTNEAKACGILKDYPYGTEIFQRTHPMADKAIEIAQKKLLRG